MRGRHFLDLSDLTREDLHALLREGARRKAARAGAPAALADADAPLAGRALAMVFEKNSTRTRVSFDIAMRQLGGETIVMSGADMQLGRGETIADTARVLSRYVDAVMLRTGAHEKLLELAANSDAPVINGLTDFSHPCQILADLMTVEERLGGLKGRKAAWCGDGNNVAVSWIQAAVLLDMTLTLACPAGYEPRGDVLGWASQRGGRVHVTTRPEEAVADADVVLTDTFVSMGDEDAERRLADLAPYKVTADLMARARREKKAEDKEAAVNALDALCKQIAHAASVDGAE
ncbi:MAG: ornithine carbamoyltransferase, partial [Pseudomonadota bacterium]